MTRIFRAVILGMFFHCACAFAGVEAIDGVPIAQNTRLMYYPVSLDKTTGYTSTISGTCDRRNGTIPEYMFIAILSGQVTSLTNVKGYACDAQGRFSGTIWAGVDSSVTSIKGERSATLIASNCLGAPFGACLANPVQVLPVTVRYLDAAAYGNVSGTSANKRLTVSLSTGTELGSQPGATGLFLAAQYAGDIYLLTAGNSVDCQSAVKISVSQTYPTSENWGCYELRIDKFSPQTFQPFVYFNAGQPGSVSATFDFGPLTGVSGVTFLGGYAKSFTELLANHQYTVIDVLH